jgi:hypothetical protein
MADFDRDGDEDFIAGNFGLNSQLKASGTQPVSLVYKDFDKNGSIDPIMISYIQGKPYPFASRDELLDQIYGMRKKFTNYELYSDAQLATLFSKEELQDAQKLEATTLQTTYFENRGGKFIPHRLPVEAQYAPVYAIEVLDYNQDGHLDFILAGNQTAIRIRMGVIDANYGQLFQGNGKGDFRYVPQNISGLQVTGDVKSIKKMTVKNEDYIFFGVNSIGVKVYKRNK